MQAAKQARKLSGTGKQVSGYWRNKAAPGQSKKMLPGVPNGQQKGRVENVSFF
ncbi:Uncharacterized protein EbC_37960 [Erwinia billingiae Eb661]|uniref:Uncharacterized protein n=1 Tax=Erwinia billingiae (strain Eb661) TaxID=634500 RepID=D8MWX0_ERWBE|nr:Uncharacterized protein EbC_37960 [Erwinia billingiae Eb661]